MQQRSTHLRQMNLNIVAHEINRRPLLSESQTLLGHFERELRGHQRLLQLLLPFQEQFCFACVVDELLLQLRFPELDIANPLRELMLGILLRSGRGSVGLPAETVAFCPQPLGGCSLPLSTGLAVSIRGMPLRGKVFRWGLDKFCHAPTTEEKVTGASYILTGDVRGRGTRAHQRKTCGSPINVATETWSRFQFHMQSWTGIVI